MTIYKTPKNGKPNSKKNRVSEITEKQKTRTIFKEETFALPAGVMEEENGTTR